MTERRSDWCQDCAHRVYVERVDCPCPSCGSVSGFLPPGEEYLRGLRAGIEVAIEAGADEEGLWSDEREAWQQEVAWEVVDKLSESCRKIELSWATSANQQNRYERAIGLRTFIRDNSKEILGDYAGEYVLDVFRYGSRQGINLRLPFTPEARERFSSDFDVNVDGSPAQVHITFGGQW